MNFKQGDFVSLENRAKYNVTRLDDGECRLFQIAYVQPNSVRLNGIDQLIPMQELRPVPIDSKEAHLIYYDPIIAASMIPEGADIPIRTVDYSYFIDAFKHILLENHISYYDMVVEKQFKYVHEIQRWLEPYSTGFQELKINNTPLILSGIKK